MTVGDKVLMQEVSAGEGFSSTNSPFLVFGLTKLPKRTKWKSSG